MSKRKLLLADDSPTIQKVINLTFADEGFDVFTVDSGTAAINRIADVKPDIVLADVQMPGLNGYEICERIRGSRQFQNLPVVLLVGADEKYDETEARRVGANDFLIKQPFRSTRQVVDKVTALLELAELSNINAVSETPGASVATDYNQENSFEDNVTNVPDDFQETIAPNEIQASADESADKVSVDVATAFNKVKVSMLAVADEMNFDDGSSDDEMIETSAGSNFVVAAGNLNSTGEKMNQASSEITDSGFDVTENNLTNQTGANSIQAAEVETEETFFATTAVSEVDAESSDSTHQNLETQTPAIKAEGFTSELTAAEDVLEFAEMPALNVALEPEELSFATESAAEVVPELEFETVGGASDNPANNSVNFNKTANFSFASREDSIDSQEALEISLDDDSLLELDDNFLLDVPNETETSVSDTAIQTSAQTKIETNESTVITPIVVQNESAIQQLEQFTRASLDDLNFPPEVIEAIATRVVEKLSDRVIEKIAWEVVPDRFDLIVRKHIDKRER